MDINIEKIFNNVLKNSKIADIDITIEDLKERYNNILNSFGEEKALEALKNTDKQIKIKASEKDKMFWLSVKNDVFQKYKTCPCAIRDLKNMIKSFEIDITGFNKEHKIKELLGMSVNL